VRSPLLEEADAALARFTTCTRAALDALAKRDMRALADALDSRGEAERALIKLTRRVTDLTVRAARDIGAGADLRSLIKMAAREGNEAAALQTQLAEDVRQARAAIAQELDAVASVATATASYGATEQPSRKQLDVRL
jgi:hypothetical protein